MKEFPRDSAGPEHRPTVHYSGVIAGVVRQRSPVAAPLRSAAGSILAELYRPEWEGVFKHEEPIEHLYFVKELQNGARDEWYFHQKTVDRYMLASGLLEVGLYDGRQDSETSGNFETVTLGEPNDAAANMLRIPQGVWHSLRWVETPGLLINSKTPLYNRDVPDKFRVPLEELPDAISWPVH